jgi:hypothetical protein
MDESVPLDGKIHPFRREERNRNVAGGLADVHIVDGIGAAPEMDANFADFTGVQWITVESAVDIVPDEPGQHGARDAEKNNEAEQDNRRCAPNAMSPGRLWACIL